MKTSAREHLEFAVSKILLHQAFYAHILLNLPFEETAAIPTAGVDGTRLFYNPDFVLSLPPAELQTVLMHEVEHIWRFHAFRMRRFESPWLYNVAADSLVNESLQRANVTFPKNPPPVLMPKLGNTTEEERYWLLLKDAKAKFASFVGDLFEPRDGDGKPLTESAEHAAIEKLKITIMEAAEIARQRGQLPGHAAQLLKAINKVPLLDLHRALRRFLSRAFQQGSDWLRPNRRLMSAGIHAPSPILRKQPPAIALAVDTSGSMAGDLARAWGIALSVIEEVKPRRIHLFLCDAAVHDYLELDPWSLPREIKTTGGGGGTSFVPVFEAIAAKRLDICAGVYISDMEGAFPEPPPYPTFWASTTGLKAPFGETFDARTA